MKLTVLGARGSVPVSGKEYVLYGGETSCYMIEAGRFVIILDAGTGILNVPGIKDDKEVVILLSHFHIDHLIGLPFFGELMNKGRKITIYGRKTYGKTTKEQINGLFEKSYWPVTPFEFPSEVECIDQVFPLVLEEAGTLPVAENTSDGDITIEAMNLNHPGGCLAFKISYMGQNIVYMTDCEIAEADIDRLSLFSRECDLLLCDSQYTTLEYETQKGFGHSTIDMAVKLGEKSFSKKILLIHHDPYHTDEQLREMEESLDNKNVFMARAGMEIII